MLAGRLSHEEDTEMAGWKPLEGCTTERARWAEETYGEHQPIPAGSYCQP